MKVRVFGFVAAAALTAALSAPALAGPPRQEAALFQAICLAHEGDLAGAEAEAAKLGLVAAIDNRGKAIGEDDVEMLFVPADGGKLEVMISPAPDRLVDTPGAAVTFCAVRGEDKDGELFAAGRALADRLGLPKADIDSPRNYSVFYSKAGMTALSSRDDEGIRAAVMADAFRVYDVRTNDYQVTMLSLMTGARGSAK